MDVVQASIMSSIIELCLNNLEPKIILIAVGYIRSQRINNHIPLNIIKICAILYQPKDYFIHTIYNKDSYVISNYGQSMRRLMHYQVESPEIHYIYGLNIINTLKMPENIEIKWIIIINQVKNYNPYEPFYLGLINKPSSKINEKSKYCEYYALNINGDAKHSKTDSFILQINKYNYSNLNNRVQNGDIIKIIFQKISNTYNILFIKKKKIILQYNNVDHPGNYRLFIHSQQHTLINILKFESNTMMM